MTASNWRPPSWAGWGAASSSTEAVKCGRCLAKASRTISGDTSTPWALPTSPADPSSTFMATVPNPQPKSSRAAVRSPPSAPQSHHRVDRRHVGHSLVQLHRDPALAMRSNTSRFGFPPRPPSWLHHAGL